MLSNICSKFCRHVLFRRAVSLPSTRNLSKQSTGFALAREQVEARQGCTVKQPNLFCNSKHTSKLFWRCEQAPFQKNFCNAHDRFSIQRGFSQQVPQSEQRSASKTGIYAGFVAIAAFLGTGFFGLSTGKTPNPLLSFASADTETKDEDTIPFPQEEKQVSVPTPIEGDFQTETATNVQFPILFQIPNGNKLVLAAHSTRVLWYLFNTYSVAIYLEPGLMRLLFSSGSE